MSNSTLTNRRVTVRFYDDQPSPNQFNKTRTGVVVSDLILRNQITEQKAPEHKHSLGGHVSVYPPVNVLVLWDDTCKTSLIDVECCVFERREDSIPASAGADRLAKLDREEFIHQADRELTTLLKEMRDIQNSSVVSGFIAKIYDLTVKLGDVRLSVNSHTIESVVNFGVYHGIDPKLIRIDVDILEALKQSGRAIMESSSNYQRLDRK